MSNGDNKSAKCPFCGTPASVPDGEAPEGGWSLTCEICAHAFAVSVDGTAASDALIPSSKPMRGKRGVSPFFRVAFGFGRSCFLPPYKPKL